MSNGFDGDAVLDVLRSEVDGRIYAIIEFDEESFNPIYLDESVADSYRDRDHMMNHFEEVHSYALVDFSTKDLFSEAFFPQLGEVEYLVTGMTKAQFLRVYRGDEGLLVELERDEPIIPLVEAIQSIGKSNN